jgi:hypothetical protein
VSPIHAITNVTGLVQQQDINNVASACHQMLNSKKFKGALGV